MLNFHLPPAACIDFGRIDASGAHECAPPGMLVGAHDTADQLRAAFYRMGFNDGEIVALAGAHSVGICRVANSGFRGPWDTTSLGFDNKFYRDILDEDRWLYDGSQFNSVTGDGTMMLQADMRMAKDSSFAAWTRLFAADELLWFNAFSDAFSKLGTLGHDRSSLSLVSIELAESRQGWLC